MKINIVQMTGNYPLDIGGTSTVAYFLATKMADSGINVSMTIRTKDKDEINKLREFSKFREMEEKINIYPITISYNLYNLPSILYKTLKTYSDFKPEKYDIIHYNSPPVDVTVFYPLKSRMKCLQTITIHGGLFYESKNFIGRYILKKYVNYFKKIIVLNSFSYSLVKKLNSNESKIEIIPNGVEVEYFDKLEKIELDGDPAIVYAGRLSQVKGIDTLIKSFLKVSKEMPNAKMYIIGDGPEKENLTKLAKKLALKNIVFMGFIPSINKVHRYIKSSDIFVLPSYKENFSISLLEAMAARTSIVVSDAEGNKDVLTKSEALFFSCGNATDLAEKIIHLGQNPSLRRNISDNAYSLAQSRYSWDNVVEKYMNVFNSLVN